MDLTRVSIGLPGATPAADVAVLAERIEQAGFRGLWMNDTPGGDSLVGLAAAASSTSRLSLATGVIPVDRRTAIEIAGASADLPSERLTLGIGSGGERHPLGLIAAAIGVLRENTSAELVVGALGPRMRELGSTLADGLLFNWLTPDAAVAAMEDLRRASSARGVLYVRTAVDPDAQGALEAEAARYGGIPSYARNLERIGAQALDTTIGPSDELPLHVERYLVSVDELVLRAITAEPTADAYRAFIDRVAAISSVE